MPSRSPVHHSSIAVPKKGNRRDYKHLVIPTHVGGRSFSLVRISFLLICISVHSHLLRVHPSSFALILTIQTHVKVGLNSKMPSRFPPVMFYKTHTLTNLGTGKHDSARL